MNRMASFLTGPSLWGCVPHLDGAGQLTLPWRAAESLADALWQRSAQRHVASTTLRRSPPAGSQVWVMAIFSMFTSAILASKKLYAASLVMLVTQLPVLYVYHQ